MPRDECSTTIWVRSDVAVDGSYVVTVNTDQDHARTLDRTSALAYAHAIVSIVGIAAYDAAIVAQMTERLKLPLDHAAQIISDLRADRPIPDDELTAPLRLVPGVAARDLRPFLTCFVEDKPIGQWEITDALDHALAVMEASVAADLDAGYYRALLGQVGVDESRARAAVADIANLRSRSQVQVASAPLDTSRD